MSSEWADPSGKAVVAKPVFEPFDIWVDPWCDLTFLKEMPIFKKMIVPTFADLVDSGVGDGWMEQKKWEREEWARKREERIEWKEMLRQNPHLKQERMYRQKKKGRTARRRAAARHRRWDREIEEEMRLAAESRRCSSIELPADYDEHVLKQTLPSSWRSNFWLISFIDDNIDYKLPIRDKSKEVFYPAEPISKRTLGYELLEFMTPGDLKRSASMCTLERKRTREVSTHRFAALNLRRSKSESDLNSESTHWNLLKEEERLQFEDGFDTYIQLVDFERKDELDQWGVDFYYNF